MSRTNFNNCTIEVYAAGSTTPIFDHSSDLARATIVSFESFYPGGLFGTAEIIVPRDPTRSWLFKQGHRLVIRNGLAVAFEGEIVNPGYYAGPGAEQGRTLAAVGYWGRLLGTRGLNKPWCDTRLTEAAWPLLTTTGGHAKVTLDRLSRIQFTPKAVAWTTNETARVQYTVPTGQTIKRVTFDYDLQEATQAWSLGLYTDTDGLLDTAVTTSGTGSKDITLGTPRSEVTLRFLSAANQTPDADGTIYARVTNLKVFSETGSITPTEIVKDWISAITTLNSDTTQVDSNTITMEPWVTRGYELAASNLARLAGFGDSTLTAAWAAYVLESESATTPNGKPVLAFKAQPALTDYDYAVRLDDPNVSGDVSLHKSEVYNWIVVSYTDELGVERVVTPDDDATLTDATSVSNWGRREIVLPGGMNNATAAVWPGKRFLFQHKDEHVYVSGPLNVTGYIRGKSGQPVPASLIRAGKRVKIDNFISDELGVTGAGLTAIISSVRYTDGDETASLSLGVPDDLAVLLARLARDRDERGGRPV